MNLPAMRLSTIFDALQLAVGPVILISAYGLLLLSMTNRLGRAIDRSRMLVRERGPRRELQLQIIASRARWIRSSILFTVIGIISAAVLVLVLFVSAVTQLDLGLPVAALFVASILSLVLALGYFMADIFGSLRAVEAELMSGEEGGQFQLSLEATAAGGPPAGVHAGGALPRRPEARC